MQKKHKIEYMRAKLNVAIASTVILALIVAGLLLKERLPLFRSPSEGSSDSPAETVNAYPASEPDSDAVIESVSGEDYIVTGTLIAVHDDNLAGASSVPEPVEGTGADPGSAGGPGADPRLPEQLRNSRSLIGLTDETIFATRISQNGLYHYDRLSESEQVLYAELLYIMQQHAENIYISAMDASTLERVQNCVLNDHPEIFYVDGYYSTRYTLQEQTIGFSFSGRYTLSVEEIALRQRQIDMYVSNCLAGISPDADDYTKVKYIYEYIIRNTDYLTASPDNQNICSVFLYGSSVCQGYAKATQYLLQRLDVPATLVVGTVSQAANSSLSGAHAWNLVRVDGDYYYVDTTWGDASFLGSEGEAEQSGIGYDFLCATSADIASTHTIGSVVEMPYCEATAANYYIRENAFFDTADMDRLKDLIARKAGEGSDTVTFKCATEEVYRQMLDLLINRNMIFELFNRAPGETVTYSRSDDKHTMTVWF